MIAEEGAERQRFVDCRPLASVSSSSSPGAHACKMRRQSQAIVDRQHKITTIAIAVFCVTCMLATSIRFDDEAKPRECRNAGPFKHAVSLAANLALEITRTIGGIQIALAGHMLLISLKDLSPISRMASNLNRHQDSHTAGWWEH